MGFSLRSRLWPRTRTIGAAATLALAAAGCAWLTASPPRSEDFATHVVESQRLRSVMKQLLALLPDDPDTMAPPTADRGEVRTEIRNVSLALADQSGRITRAIGRRQLPASQRERFIGLAEALRQSATALADEAETLPATQLQARFDAVLATCNGCHDEFRGARGS